MDYWALTRFAVDLWVNLKKKQNNLLTVAKMETMKYFQRKEGLLGYRI